MSRRMQVALRSTGLLPLSIGTSLAVEALSDRQDPDTGKVIPAPELPDFLWVNLRTIIRNLHGAIENRELRNALDPEDFIDVAVQECEFLVTHLEELSREKTKVVFYYSQPTDIETIFPHANIKQRTSKGAVTAAAQYAAIEDSAIELLHTELQRRGHDSREFKTLIKGDSTHAFVITHCPIDLLAEKDFLSLTLVESHTGRLKKRPEWNTKLGKQDGVELMPFNELTLQVFGDNSVFLSPMAMAFKKELIQLAKKYSWTPLTTREKISYGLSSIEDLTVRQILREIH